VDRFPLATVQQTIHEVTPNEWPMKNDKWKMRWSWLRQAAYRSRSFNPCGQAARHSRLCRSYQATVFGLCL